MTDAGLDIYRSQVEDIIAYGIAQISSIRPSDWTEQNVVMPGKPFPGPFSYSRTPYMREIIDCLSPDHPARKVALMKGAQIGGSAGVIYPALGWIIANSPANTFVTVGHEDLVPEAMGKLDTLIDNAGLRKLIRPTAMRRRNNKTGDTNNKKEFGQGYIIVASANNHKVIRQRDLMYGFFDDIESVRSASKESGNTLDLLEQRFAAYGDSHKIYYISTPERAGNSNIYNAYIRGDQRRFLLPCPCCGEMIALEWNIDIDGNAAGIFWKLDNHERLIEDSVGYICQKCAGFFKDNNKQRMLNDGIWNPTAIPSRPDFFSYHLSALYAPVGMFDWKHYVYKYLEANPIGQPRIEKKHQTHVNVCLGLPYEEETEAPKANAIQKNTRPYDIGTVPERLSQADGNGNIVMLTCAADMNGKMEEGNHDVRLDFEILAWSESGATYSIKHGSIGTFIPRETAKQKQIDRKKWTYEDKKPNSVWPEFEQILGETFKTDTGREMNIMITGLDCGHHSTHAYGFIDRTNYNVYGLKGDKEDKYLRFGQDVRVFKPALERSKLFILQVGVIKDRLSEYMALNWHDAEMQQPSNFMNFPQPADGLYQFSNFFEHFETEHRVLLKNEDGEGVSARWVKKTSTVQNHMWDCRVYNLALQLIIIDIISKELKNKLTWGDVCAILQGTYKG